MSLSYPIRPLLLPLIISTILFIVFLILGYLNSDAFSLELSTPIREMAQSFADLDPFFLMVIIIVNNAIKLLLVIMLGFAFSILPVLFLVGNGLVIGVVMGEVMQTNGPLLLVGALLPHGWIEIPVFLLSSAIGMRIGYVTYLKMRGTDYQLKREIFLGIQFYLRRLFPLLLIAAIIEAYLTPILIEFLVP